MKLQGMEALPQAAYISHLAQSDYHLGIVLAHIEIYEYEWGENEDR